MRSYVVREGDSFARISQRVYALEDFADTIKSANPQALGGLTPGMVLVIPDVDLVPDLPRTVVRTTSENEVSISIGGNAFKFWTDMSLTRSIDSFDTFSLGAPFEPDNAAFRAAFVPLSFQTVVLNVAGVPLFTGTLVNPRAELESGANTAVSDGYALAGVLNDCQIPAGNYPVEVDGNDLRDIAIALCKPFGLSVTFPSNTDQGPAFERVAMEITDRVLAYLTKEAQQRGLVISNDTRGMPVFQVEREDPPIANLEVGDEQGSPILAITPEFNAQRYFSSITGITPSLWGDDGVATPVANPHLEGVVRPHTFKIPDTNSGDAGAAVRGAMGRMFASAVSYTLSLAGWRDPSGNLWEPNTRIRLKAPRAMIYESSLFVIRSVTLARNSEEDIAQLQLVLPGSFSGKIPDSLPWGEL